MTTNPFEEILTEIRELKSLIIDQPATIQQKPVRRNHIRGIHGLAEFLECSPSTAQKLKNSGTIPYSQQGRLVMFDPDKVLDALEEHAQNKRK